jgi:hypothetical protein
MEESIKLLGNAIFREGGYTNESGYKCNSQGRPMSLSTLPHLQNVSAARGGTARKAHSALSADSASPLGCCSFACACCTRLRSLPAVSKACLTVAGSAVQRQPRVAVQGDIRGRYRHNMQVPAAVSVAYLREHPPASLFLLPATLCADAAAAVPPSWPAECRNGSSTDMAAASRMACGRDTPFLLPAAASSSAACMHSQSNWSPQPEAHLHRNCCPVPRSYAERARTAQASARCTTEGKQAARCRSSGAPEA